MRIWRAVILGVLGVLGIWVMVVSFHLALRWNDELEYLNNARFLAGYPSAYLALRTPLVPLLYVPVAWLTQGNFFSLFHGAAVLNVLLTATGLFAFFQFIRAEVSPQAAWFSLLLLGLNPLVLHYAHLVTIDVPTLATLSWFLWAWDCFRKMPNFMNALWMGLALGASLLLRWNLWYLPMLILGEAMVQRLQGHKIISGRLSGIAFLTMVLGLGSFIAVNAWVTQSWTRGFGQWLEILAFYRGAHEETQIVTDPSYAGILVETLTVPTLGLAVLGVFITVWKRRDGLRYLIVLGVGILVLEMLDKANEARYLLSFLPLCYAFVALGYETLCSRLQVFGGKQRALALVSAAFLLFPLWEAPRALNYFRQPFFYQPFLHQITDYVDQHLKPETRILWVNSLYALYPRQMKKSWGVVADFIHLSPLSFENMIGRPVSRQYLSLFNEKGQSLGDVDLLQLNQEERIVNLLDADDLMIVSHAEYFTLDAYPDEIPPFQIIRCEKISDPQMKISRRRHEEFRLYAKDRDSRYFRQVVGKDLFRKNLGEKMWAKLHVYAIFPSR